METTKYNYLKVIQQNYGFGWEDVSEYETDSNYTFPDKAARDLFKHDIAEYRLTGYATRSISRRTLKGIAIA